MSAWDKKKEETPVNTSPVIPVVQEESKPQTFVIKTEIDAQINERLQTQPKTLDEIQVRELNLPDGQGIHALTLPKQIKDILEKRGLAGFWINKKKKAIDHALDDRGWTLFNRVYFPEVSKHNFTANGTVERGDCILGFMPIKNAEKLRRRPGEISQERIKELPIDRYKSSQGGEKVGFYKPAYTAEPEGEMAKKEAGLFAQPDLPTETNE